MKKTLQAVVSGIVAVCAIAAPAMAQSPNRISWSGHVDSTIIVHIHRDHVRVETVDGQPPTDTQRVVSEPLPETPVHVWLSEVHGRGSIQLVQEPNSDNNYTALVRISDPQPGRGYYTFVLRWHDYDMGGNGNNGDGGNGNQ